MFFVFYDFLLDLETLFVWYNPFFEKQGNRARISVRRPINRRPSLSTSIPKENTTPDSQIQINDESATQGRSPSPGKFLRRRVYKNRLDGKNNFGNNSSSLNYDSRNVNGNSPSDDSSLLSRRPVIADRSTNTPSLGKIVIKVYYFIYF